MNETRTDTLPSHKSDTSDDPDLFPIASRRHQKRKCYRPEEVAAIAAARMALRDKAKFSFAEALAAYPAGWVDSPEWIYFVTDGDAIKIGVTATVERRIADLQRSHHRPLILLGQMAGDRWTEQRLHRRWRRFRIRGEWFQDAPEIRRFIATGVAR